VIKDRDLKSGKPLIIVCKTLKKEVRVFTILLNKECVVKHHKYTEETGIEQKEEIRVKYSELIGYIVKNDGEKLYRYLLNRMKKANR